MYNYIKGTLENREPAMAVVEAGGVGYEIKISLITYAHLQGKKECKLFIYMQVTDNAHTLFGFHDLNEKGLFMHLISISGIGPNTALAFMSSLSVDEVKEAIVSEDAKTIQSIKGIGAKTAQRVILELKDKLIKEGFSVGSSSSGNASKGEMSVNNKVKLEALEALVSLGISKNVAEKSINMIVKKEGNDLKVEQLIKLALKR